MEKNIKNFTEIFFSFDEEEKWVWEGVNQFDNLFENIKIERTNANIKVTDILDFINEDIVNNEDDMKDLERFINHILDCNFYDYSCVIYLGDDGQPFEYNFDKENLTIEIKYVRNIEYIEKKLMETYIETIKETYKLMNDDDYDAFKESYFDMQDAHVSLCIVRDMFDEDLEIKVNDEIKKMSREIHEFWTE